MVFVESPRKSVFSEKKRGCINFAQYKSVGYEGKRVWILGSFVGISGEPVGILLSLFLFFKEKTYRYILSPTGPHKNTECVSVTYRKTPLGLNFFILLRKVLYFSGF